MRPSESRIVNLAGMGRRRLSLPSALCALASREKGQPFEQVHVLLVLEQRAVQRRDQLPGSVSRRVSGEMSSLSSSLIQSSSSEVEGFFLMPGTSLTS